MFLLNLYGATNAENKVLLLFNVPVSRAAAVEKYLADNNLFADEPSRISGKGYTEYSIEVDTASAKLPLARVRFQLASWAPVASTPCRSRRRSRTSASSRTGSTVLRL